MYDIICDIWKNPGAAYSPMYVWEWRRASLPGGDVLVERLDSLHKCGVDGVVIKPDALLCASDSEYFARLRALLEAAKKRRMLVTVWDEYVNDTAGTFDARMLYPVRAGEEKIGETLFRVYLRLEDGFMTDVKLSPCEGYTEYDLVLGRGGAGYDLLSPYTADMLVKNSFERYYANLSEYFGSTLIGFFAHITSDRQSSLDGGVLWSEGMAEDFFAAGGDMTALVSLMFPVREKKIHREAEHSYFAARADRIGSSYYKKASEWCRTHGVALVGFPPDGHDGSSLAYFDIPGARLVCEGAENEHTPTAEDVQSMKFASDCARHAGISRSSAVCFGGVCNTSLSPDGIMRTLNSCFAAGISLVYLCSVYDGAMGSGTSGCFTRTDYKMLSGYIKRMSWLGATGTDNPTAAVLCSDEFLPATSAAPLNDAGYTYNYLTTDDFMKKAHIRDGRITIDRYSYGTLLVDSRLRLDAGSVTKIGEFVTGGGDMYRGTDFISHMKKSVRLTSCFISEGDMPRYIKYTKSGCTFFVMINEGTDDIKGQLITDENSRAAVFDPFTGQVRETSCVLCDGGFSYDVRIPARSSLIIGMDKGKLPLLGGEEKSREVIREIISLGCGRMSFDYNYCEGCRATLSFTRTNGTADVTVNGCAAGRVLFMPYELDITQYLKNGLNEVAVSVSVVRNKDDIAMPDFEGCTVRIFGKE